MNATEQATRTSETAVESADSEDCVKEFLSKYGDRLSRIQREALGATDDNGFKINSFQQMRFPESDECTDGNGNPTEARIRSRKDMVTYLREVFEKEDSGG